MLLILLSVSLSILAIGVLVMVTVGTSGSSRVSIRLAALQRHEFAPAAYEEKVTDIRRAQDQLSAIPWLNKWLRKLNFSSVASRYLYQAGMTVSVGRMLMISASGSAAIAGILFLRLGSVGPALLLSLGFLPLPLLYVRMKRARRLTKLEQQLPEALGMMVSALRVGHSLVASLGAVAQECAAPISTEIRKCFDEQNYGVDLRVALVNMTERAPIQDFRIFVAAVLIQKESGGNLAEVLEKVAQTTRERFRLKKQVSVHTAQGRMTGWILSLLPVALGLGMYLVNPDGISILWKRSIGLKLLYGASAMDIVGALLIRKIVAIKV